MAGVEVLSQSYPTTEAALAAIDVELTHYYQTSYPDVYATRRDAVRQAIRVVQDIYRKNIFPEMRVDWKAYPNNIGHKESAGCFRCHDLRHLSASGRAIPADCDLCHAIPTTVGIDETFAARPVRLPPKPDSHRAPRWTVSHGSADRTTCPQCHQQNFCAYGPCHQPEWTSPLHASELIPAPHP